MKKVWERSLPHAQKVKDAARSHFNTLKLVPRRLLWGVGLAVLTVALIIFGVRVSHRPASKPQPATVTAPVVLPADGRGAALDGDRRGRDLRGADPRGQAGARPDPGPG